MGEKSDEIQEKSRNRRQQQFQQQKPNESILRVSFLEQAAALLANTEATSSSPLSAQPTGPSRTNGKQIVQSSTANLLSRLLLRELRECAFVDQLRMHRDFKRSHCKRCFQNWVFVSNTDSPQIEVKACRGAVVRICKNCGAKRRFPTTNPNYRSRNEKTEHF